MSVCGTDGARRLRSAALALIPLLWIGQAAAEQKQVFGDYEAHYGVVPTLFLEPEVAGRYGLTRGRDQALVNVSVLGPGGLPVTAHVSGTVQDLLGQVRDLAFDEVVEGDAVYYLAVIHFDDLEVLRFAIEIGTPDGGAHDLTFQQKMYREAP